MTQPELAAGAVEIGLGLRRGERRYALRAMIEQDKVSTLRWLGELATRWAARHTSAYGATAAGRWWSRRAAASSRAFLSMAREVW